MIWKCLIIFFACAATLSAEVKTEIKVLVFAGSTRADSVNKKLAIETAHLARQMGATVTLIDLKDYPMPLYDGDLEAQKGMPAQAKKFRQLIQENRVIFIASPEYNGSVSAVLKNAIDWASRTEEGEAARKVFKGKKIALMSASSTRSSGGKKGLPHLREILKHLGGSVITPEVSVSKASNAFDEQGHLRNPKVKVELQQLILEAFKAQL